MLSRDKNRVTADEFKHGLAVEFEAGFICKLQNIHKRHKSLIFVFLIYIWRQTEVRYRSLQVLNLFIV